MIATAPDYWISSREHQGLTVESDGVAVADYEVAIVRHPDMYTAADWKPSSVFAGRRGVWIEDTLLAGTYRIWARVGEGAPNERPIVLCGFINVRSR